MELHGDDVSVNTANGISYIDNSDRTETTPLQGSHNDTKGLKVIVSCLTIMTVIVSIALGAQMYYGDNNHFLHGSVVTDHHDCSVIGGKILRKGGNAVDAAIASAICMGVVHPHLTGIGGGGFMLVYDQRLRKLLDCIDFRPSKSIDISVGVPGFIAGLYSGHLKHGKLSWSAIVSYSIDLARNGYRITESLVSSISFLKANSSYNGPLEKWLNSLKLGSIGFSKKLGDTLEALAKSGADAFYNGSFATELSGHISPLDLSRYQIGRGACLDVTKSGFHFFVPGPGSGGPVLLDLLSHLNTSNFNESTFLPIVSAVNNNVKLNWPYGYGVQVLAMDDSDIYVTVVSGLGSVLGSQVLMPGGYILNNALDIGHVGMDNKPISLAVPMICVEENKVCGRRLLLGSSDARDLLQLLTQLLYTKDDVQLCVESPRARISSTIFVEDNHAPSFSSSELMSLKTEGFDIQKAPPPYPSLNTIQKISDVITAYADSRGQGEAVTL